MWRIGLLIVLAVGCYYDQDVQVDMSKVVEGPPGAEEARIATCAAFDVSNCPPVYWYGAEFLDCANGTGFIDQDGGCSGGVTGANGIIIAYLPSITKASDSGQTHELAHWKWQDAGHTDLSIWGPGGIHDTPAMHIPGTRVGDQNVALAAAGM